MIQSSADWYLETCRVNLPTAFAMSGIANELDPATRQRILTKHNLNEAAHQGLLKLHSQSMKQMSEEEFAEFSKEFNIPQIVADKLEDRLELEELIWGSLNPAQKKKLADYAMACGMDQFGDFSEIVQFACKQEGVSDQTLVKSIAANPEAREIRAEYKRELRQLQIKYMRKYMNSLSGEVKTATEKVLALDGADK